MLLLVAVVWLCLIVCLDRDEETDRTIEGADSNNQSRTENHQLETLAEGQNYEAQYTNWGEARHSEVGSEI